MNMLFRYLGLLAVVCCCFGARAAVVINEIFYHAPNDWDRLQWIELFNSGKEAVDVSGWSLTKAVKLKFPVGTKIDAGGYLVITRDNEVFKRFYSVSPARFIRFIRAHRRSTASRPIAVWRIRLNPSITPSSRLPARRFPRCCQRPMAACASRR